jgi:lipoprotein-anchoring transpeptidase ErfK/SrfK
VTPGTHIRPRVFGNAGQTIQRDGLHIIVLSRRTLIAALAGAPLAACNTPQTEGPQLAAADDLTNSFAALPGEPEKVSAIELARGRPELSRALVPYKGPERPGTVIVQTNERKLYLVLGDGRAIRYPVGVGRAGKQWQGRAEIDGKHVDPAWAPPEEIKRDNPRLPDVIPGGSPRNPMGPRALTLSGGEQYAIHGTNRPHSVGRFATYGCIRMFNEDIVDLFDRVSVGTQVLVTL